VGTAPRSIRLRVEGEKPRMGATSHRVWLRIQAEALLSGAAQAKADNTPDISRCARSSRFS